jgi:hypothetical protein
VGYYASKRKTHTEQPNILNTYFNFAESKEKKSRGKQTKTNAREDDASPDEGVAHQARKSTRWMPRRIRPMKDAETGETFKGSCMRAMSLEIPNGATPLE